MSGKTGAGGGNGEENMSHRWYGDDGIDEITYGCMEGRLKVLEEKSREANTPGIKKE